MPFPDEDANLAENNKQSAGEGKKAHHVLQLQSSEQAAGTVEIQEKGGKKGWSHLRLL